MPRVLQIFAAVAAVAGVASLTSANAVRNFGADDDKNKETVEVRLLKILKDRGVIKENEYEELLKLGKEMRTEDTLTSAAIEREITELRDNISQAVAAKKADPGVQVSYKMGDGVRFQQGDSLNMVISAYVQPRFTFVSPKGSTGTGNDDRASFEVRRTEMKFEGSIFDRDLTFKLQFDPAATAGTPLRDAYINYKFDPSFQVRAGQMRRAFTRQNFVGSCALQIIERSSATEVFRQVVGDRDDGVMFWGTFGDGQLFEWYGGAFNGEGLNSSTGATNIGSASSGLNVANSSNNDSSGVDLMGRIVFNPFGTPGYTEGDLDLTRDVKLAIGAGFDHNPERRGNPIGIATGVGGIPAGQLPNYDIDTWEGDFSLKYQGLYISTEFFYREISPAGNLQGFPGSFNTSTMSGWYAQVGYFVSDTRGVGPEVALRYSTIDYDQNILPASVAGGDTKIDDYTAAFNYYFAGHSLKLQTAYTYRIETLRMHNPQGIDHIFQAGLQLQF
ncbi:MAG: hypothetical protein HY286_18295 [Planctomycetes bacterium]|nr:hypothetical protein [Planctomycetota bacterium]